MKDTSDKSYFKAYHEVKTAEKAKKNTHVFTERETSSTHVRANPERLNFYRLSCAVDCLDLPRATGLTLRFRFSLLEVPTVLESLTAVNEKKKKVKNTSKERLLLLLFKVWYFTSIPLIY